MKAIYSITISFLLLFITALFPNNAGAVVCQNKTVIVFSNGMFNDVEEANTLKTELQKKLMSFSQVFKDEVKYEFTLAFTSDGSQYKLNGTNPIIKLANYAVAAANVGVQVTEVVLQKVAQDNFSAFSRWIGGVAPAGSRLQSELNNLASAANSYSILFDPDLQSQVADYTKLLNAGKRIVIVSHSQGNFYANAAYSALILNTPAWANSVGVVQVATPAASNQGSKLGNNEPQITVPEDMVMTAVQLLNPGLTMPTKPASGLSRNFLELGGTRAYLSATGGHNFVTWYLAGTDTRDFIMKGIVDTINGVNGVGGLQYPTQGCTTPVAGVPIPQLGPFYYRDDWGDLTYLFDRPDRYWYTLNDQYWQFKNLRDDVRGLAYRVDMERTYIGPSRNSYAPPYNLVITVTDYTNNERGAIRHTITGNFVPDDVLLWSGGLVFLSYHGGTGNVPQIDWRKFNIQDAGSGTINRWSIAKIAPGLFNKFPTYNVTRTIAHPSRGYAYQIVSKGQSWKKRSVAYRDGANYIYRVPYTASEAQWTNPPAGNYGYWLNGVYQSEPVLTRKTYSGEYGVLEISDGSLAFRKGGVVQLETINGVQPVQKPILNGFTQIKQSMAYKYTQSFMTDADLVDETSILQWYSYGASGLKAELVNGEKLFSPPSNFHRNYRMGAAASLFYPNSEIFVPFSLSSSMAMLWESATFETWFSHSETRYKLGLGFRINSNDPKFQAISPPLSLPWFSRTQGLNNLGMANLYIIMTPKQKLFMENTVNTVP